jgi:hypothetical protein
MSDFNKDHALTLAAEAEEDERNATPGPWTVPQGNRLLGAVSANIDGLDRQVASACGQAPQFEDVPDVAKRMSDNALAISRMRNRNPQVASMLRAAVARVEELEAETRAVRMTEADLVRMPMSDLDHHKAELLAMLTDRDSLRAKLAEVTKERDALVRVSVHWEEQTVKWRLEAGKYLTERDTARARVHELDAECRSLHEMLTAVEHRAGDAEAALGGMTKERDWAVAVQRAALESQERLGTTLAAVLKAKGEACDIAERLGTVTTTGRGAVYQHEQCRRIAALRSIGRAEPCDTAELPVVKITQVAELLSEACNRWEWFAQRFGAVDTREHYDYPRLAEMRGAITRITELRSVGKEKP